MDRYRLQELPETYKRYKTFTSDFEGWLMETAKNRGLEVAAQAEAAAKAKERSRKGKRGKPYKILAKDLLPVAQAVAGSGQPDQDRSGLTDLNDAIRMRKEITDYYRHQSKSDEGHPFFITILSNVRDVLKAWISPLPAIAEEHDVDNESASVESIFHVVNLTNDLGKHDDDESEEKLSKDQDNSETSPEEPAILKAAYENEHSSKNASCVGRTTDALTRDELDLEEEFEVLCFLYDLKLLRESIAEAWHDWKDQKIGLQSAAVVSDLGLGIVRQKAMALTEDLADTASKQKLTAIIKKVYRQMSIEKQPNLHCNQQSEKQDAAHFQATEGLYTMGECLRELLCMDGVDCMEAYWAQKHPDPTNRPVIEAEDHRTLAFLFYFDRIRTNELRIPILDRFSQAICSPKARTELWLPFGFQILLDIQNITQHDNGDAVLHDISFHAVHMLELMKIHVEYEDAMWAADNKPDYMSVGDTKFSNIFLPAMHRLLDWHKQVAGEDEIESTATHVIENKVFLTLHPILGGLAMYYYHDQYHDVAIQKVQWFVVGLAHLYNACKQVGGLSQCWPDLEFIIQTQGVARVFVGSPPTDPTLFRTRLSLAMCTSTRWFAKERRSTWTRAPLEAKKKRGLVSHFPLEAKIRDCFRSGADDKRWIRLHNLFSYLKHELDAGQQQSTTEEADNVSTGILDLRDAFASIADRMLPQAKKRKRRKKNIRVRVPDFSRIGSIHERLLLTATARLRDLELHACFDYLAFFRRAYALVTHIRGEVLWNSTMPVNPALLDRYPEEPPNFLLLCDLFNNLQIKPKNENVEATGTELSQDVVALRKLKEVAAIMQDFIREEGGSVLKSARAKMLMQRGWYEDAASCEDTVDHYQHGTDARPQRIFHRFTYSSTVARKRKRAALHIFLMLRLGFTPMKKGFRHRLIGARKHCISFRCLGQCIIGRCLRDKAQDSRNVSLPQKASDMNDIDDGWETDNECAEQGTQQTTKHPSPRDLSMHSSTQQHTGDSRMGATPIETPSASPACQGSATPTFGEEGFSCDFSFTPYP